MFSKVPSEAMYIPSEAENMPDRLEMIWNLKICPQMASILTLNNVYEDLRIKYLLLAVCEKAST